MFARLLAGSPRLIGLLLALMLASLAALAFAAKEFKSGKIWAEPKVVDPGPPGGPPSDAIVLFDGKDMSQFNGADAWKVADGVVTVQKSSITTKESFGDCQLHIEWASPEKVEGAGQGRGNSGIHFQGQYEIQILDSYENPTYFDGQAASLYKQAPPLVNACRKPGEWQTYDIVFERPRFAADGKVARPGHVTVLQNGVLVQNHTEIEGATAWDKPPIYAAHADRLPIGLQNHGDPVRFRNIWIRDLEGTMHVSPLPPGSAPAVATPDK